MKIATGTVKAKDLSPSTPVPLKNQEVLGRLNDRIASRAYEIFENDGGNHGKHLRHWLQAEAQTLKRIPEIIESSSWYTVRVPLQGFAKEDVSLAVEPHRAIVAAEKVSSVDGTDSSNSAVQDSLFLVAAWPGEADPATASAYIKNESLVLTVKRANPEA
jgi:HSP20 family molecular chaperone IbpA